MRADRSPWEAHIGVTLLRRLAELVLEEDELKRLGGG